MNGPLSKAQLVAQTKRVAEIESSFRIYIKEWLYAGRAESHEKALAGLTERFGGRVRAQDMQVLQDWDESWLAMVRRWNLAAEVKTEQLSVEFLDALVREGYEAVMVARNSRAEHELAQYGTILLPKAQLDDGQ